MTAGNTEFELKFSGNPADVAALLHSEFVSTHAPAGGRWERLSSTYYDTSDNRLARQGLSLRLREEAGTWVQAIKKQGDSSAARYEVELVLPTSANFPAKVGNKDLDSVIQPLAPVLERVASTTVDRWASQIVFKGACIELAVDLGRAECLDEEGSAHAAPLAEIELELLTGKPKRAFQLARRLLSHGPLRYRALSKLETAQRLALPFGAIPPASRTQVLEEMTAVDALQRSLCDIASRLSEIQPYIVDYRAPEGVHQMRVALRRLRSIERVFRPYLNSSELRELAEKAKSVAGALGPARDWDVFLGETLPVVRNADDVHDGWTAIKARAEEKRAEAWSDAAGLIAGKDFSYFVLDVLEAGVRAPWRKRIKTELGWAVTDFAPVVLDRALSRTFKVAESAPLEGDLSARHPLRIALKKLRYPVQLFRPLYAKGPRKGFMAALSSMQDAFGAVNDAVVAQTLADQAAVDGGDAMRAAGFIAGYKMAEAQKAARAIDETWRAFENMTPFWRSQD